jgi:hypothetical protein
LIGVEFGLLDLLRDAIVQVRLGDTQLLAPVLVYLLVAAEKRRYLAASG